MTKVGFGGIQIENHIFWSVSIGVVLLRRREVCSHFAHWTSELSLCETSLSALHFTYFDV